MAGKGDGRRPRAVPYEEYARRHAKTFGGGNGFDGSKGSPERESDSGSIPDASMRGSVAASTEGSDPSNSGSSPDPAI